MGDEVKKGYIDKLYRILKGGGYQRTLHYHNTPGTHEALYEEQMKYIAEHYHTVSATELGKRLRGRRNEKQEETDGRRADFRAGKGYSLVIGLFDGYRNNFDVMYPILEKYGQTAWYLLVADFLDAPVQEQEGRLEQYSMQYLLGEYKDRRYAMNWEEARQAAQNHTIVNHSSTHFFLKQDSEKEVLDYEINHSHELIVNNTGVIPKVFSWLGGAEYSTNSAATKMLQEKGYEYLVGYELENIAPVPGGLTKTVVERDLPEDPGASEEPKCASAECRCVGEEQCASREDWCAASAEFREEKLLEEINYHQRIMETIGIFSGVPAILPMYQAEAPEVGKGEEEDLLFASHFYQLASYLWEHLRISEWEAAHRALDIMAVNMIGEGFPYHLS